jgi:hypothetical protein
MKTSFLNPDQLAAQIPLSPATIRRYAKEGRIPSISTPGGHRRYVLEDVLAALNGIGNMAVEEILSDIEMTDFGVPPSRVVRVIHTRAKVNETPTSLSTLTDHEWELYSSSDGDLRSLEQ